MQDPHQKGGEAPEVLSDALEKRIEMAVARELRAFRKQHGMTLAVLARRAGLSTGTLSKIENGVTSPSLATLYALSNALQVPVTAFFRKFEAETDATFVRAGEGLEVKRRGIGAWRHFQLFIRNTHPRIVVESYLVSLTERHEAYPLFQHPGMEFHYMLEGELRYRHGDKTYLMKRGDSLYFDGDVPHGPSELITLPISFLSIVSNARGESEIRNLFSVPA